MSATIISNAIDNFANKEFTAYIMSRDCVLNDAKARSMLGYRPKVTVEDGLTALSGPHGE